VNWVCPNCKSRFLFGRRVCRACGHEDHVRFTYRANQSFVRRQVKHFIWSILFIVAMCLLTFVVGRVSGWQVGSLAVPFFLGGISYAANLILSIVPGSTELVLTDSYLSETHSFLQENKLKLEESVLTCSDPPDADDVLYYLTKKKEEICLDSDTFEDMDSLRDILLTEVPFVPPDEYDQYVRLHWR
jgi:hypothetical protein